MQKIIPEDIIKEATELREAGKTFLFIGRKFGIDEKTIAKYIRKYQEKMGIEPAKPRLKRKSVPRPRKPKLVKAIVTKVAKYPKPKSEPRIADTEKANERLQAFQTWLDSGRKQGYVALLLQVAMDIELEA